MQWLKNQTDRDWDAQHLVNEALRHERRQREDSMVGMIETTPADEPIPHRSTMAQTRQDLLMEDVGEIKRVFRQKPILRAEMPAEDDDSIPL